jgi:hypothetical protein
VFIVFIPCKPAGMRKMHIGEEIQSVRENMTEICSREKTSSVKEPQSCICGRSRS